MSDEPEYIGGDEGGKKPGEPGDLSFFDGLKERLQWALRMSLLVFILAAAAFLSAITAMRIAIHGREVGMPNLVGKNVTEAGAMLRSRGLGLRVADHVYSDLPVNVVVRQTPPPGMQMKVQQQAHVVLSLGQRALQIPAIEGNSLRVSRIELLRGGLQVGEVSNVQMPDQAVDTVVIQSPKKGASAATPRVDVLVSAGPHENSFVMPHLVGFNEEEAQRRLEASGIKRRVNGVSAPQWPHGTVIDQAPLAGTRVYASTQVELTTAD
jgi:eukaryotic-like serine/threonine-protein kinase